MNKYLGVILVFQSLSMCSSLTEFSKEKTFKIILGREVSPKYKYPYQAFFAPSGYKCAGTIIGRKHILTADHCIKGKRPNSRTYVIVGEHKITSNDAYGSQAQAFFGSNLIRVKRYIRNSRNRGDIGILELEREMQFSDRIQPACIPERNAEDYVGRDAIVTGWGGTVGYNPNQIVNQRGSEVLRETTLRVQSPQSGLCRRAFATDAYKLCGYRKGHDTCQGDSGGPMAVKENGRFVVIGVTSSGQGCGATGYAGIYTRVSFYHDWIKDNVRDVCTSGTLPSTSPSTTPRPTSTTPSTNSNYIQPTASTTILQGCSCSDFVNKNGFGRCSKEDSDFGGLLSCYVNLPTTCTDLVGSGSNPGKYLSANACKIGGLSQLTTEQPFVMTPTTTGCSCSNFMNKNGFGRCRKEDSDFGGLKSCYIKLPSTCSDLVQSGSNPQKYLSAEACGTTSDSQPSSIPQNPQQPSSLPDNPQPSISQNPSQYSTPRPYIPKPYGQREPPVTSYEQRPSERVRCGTCQTWDSLRCRPGEIQFAETCGKCPIHMGWFYCPGEFGESDCKVIGEGTNRKCVPRY